MKLVGMDGILAGILSILLEFQESIRFWPESVEEWKVLVLWL